MADLTTLETVKRYLGTDVGDTDDDALLTSMIGAARARLLSETGRNFSATFTETFDGDGTDVLVLSRSPVVSVSSVKVNGDTIPQRTTVTGSGWVLSRSEVSLAGSVFFRGEQNVEVTYVAGWDSAQVPEDVDFASVELVASWFRGKEHVGVMSTNIAGAQTNYVIDRDGLPASVQRVVDLYRALSF